MVTYEIMLPHAASARLAAAFPEFRCTDDGAERMVLRGELRDQAELHSVLSRVADLGLDIGAVTRIDPAPPERDG